MLKQTALAAAEPAAPESLRDKCASTLGDVRSLIAGLLLGLHPTLRWCLLALLLLAFGHRVAFVLHSFCLIAYALAVYLLDLASSYCTPGDPLFDPLAVAAGSPEVAPLACIACGGGEGDRTRGSFAQQLQEQQRQQLLMFPAEYLLWERCSAAVLLAFAATLFPVLDVPVFCSVLVAYFVIVVLYQAKTVFTRRREAHARNFCDVGAVVQ